MASKEASAVTLWRDEAKRIIEISLGSPGDHDSRKRFIERLEEAQRALGIFIKFCKSTLVTKP